MTERISWKGDKGIYQPRIRAVRIRNLHAMREFTHRPMTVLVDEALELYLIAFQRSLEITGNQYKVERAIDQRSEIGQDENGVISSNIDNT